MLRHIGILVVLLCVVHVLASSVANRKVCSYKNIFFVTKPINVCPVSKKTIYFLYDVNPVEGFNLRRDVYIRLAVFIKSIRKKSCFERTKLVLPPFPRLYHWKSDYIQQDTVPWRQFFDISSFKKYTAVLDFDEFLRELGISDEMKIQLRQVYKLQNFEDMFVNGVFTDKFEEQNCRKEDHLRRSIFNNPLVIPETFACLKFQGSASLLEKFMKKKLKSNKSWPFSIMFFNAEIVLHDHWGNSEFWKARRSMRFNKALVDIATQYRLVNFNSSDETDKIQRPGDWRDEKVYRGAVGGMYLCAHIRRGDFVHGREGTTPSLKSIAGQILSKLKEHKLSKVFIASDCNSFEFQNLKSYLGRSKVYRFKPESFEQKSRLLDGGVAIVDQVICSYARYFIGTYESTFTYRIYEEREILGFPKDATFNTFCKNQDLTSCEKNSIWPIEY